MSEDQPNPDRVWFTPLLNRIADAAGERAALILGREKAGQQIYIPKNVSEEHWLAQMIGLQPAQMLVDKFSDEKIVLPRSLDGQKRDRARTIAELRGKGYSLNKIVQMTGLARNTVRAHLDRLKDDRQGTLF